MKFTTNNYDETFALGKRMGKGLKGDETIALIGELGAGKTAFVQGLAFGLGATNHVTSPTFVLEKIYKGNRGKVLHHFDVYRIEGNDVDSTGLPEILGEAIVVVEWADKIKNILPNDTIWIEINIKGENKREFIFKLPDDKKYLT